MGKDEGIRRVEDVHVPFSSASSSMSSPAEWYASLPQVTKTCGTILVLTTLGSTLQLLDLRTMYLDWFLVTRKMQVWRILTCFTFVGGFSMRFLVKILLLAQHGLPLERSTYQHRMADYVYMHVFSGACLLMISFLLPGLGLHFLGSPLLYVVLYVWSRNFPDTSVNIMGMMKVQGFYLPWIYVAMDLVMGANPVESLLGIFVGHLYYFFGTLHPMRTGKNFLGTPLWFRNMVENGTSTSRSYSRPGWQGRGRRLSD